VRNQASEKFGVNSTRLSSSTASAWPAPLSIEEMEKEFAPYLKG